MEVLVYSNCERVSLTLNGKEIGTSETNRNNKFTAIFEVPYRSGTLLAIGYNGNQVVEEIKLHSAGEAVALRIASDGK